MSGTGQGKRLATIVGDNIRQRRAELGWTQGELARYLGGKVNSQRISDWERGAYRPNDTSLLRLCGLLDREFAWFFVDHDDEKVAA